MKWKSLPRILQVTTIVLISLIGISSFFDTNTTIISYSTGASQPMPWKITLTINEPSGAGNIVEFGEQLNASNGQDSSDIPAPPMPPTLPAITAWFETPFPLPFDKLINEFKLYPTASATWNLTILWLPAPGNITSTNITLHWDPSEILKNPGQSLFLYENSTILTNMLTTQSYSYETNSTPHQFQIISQNHPSNNTSEQNTIPMLPLIIFILVLFMVIIIVLFLLYRRREKSRLSENKISPTDELKSDALREKILPTFEENTSQELEKKKSQISAKKKSPAVKKKKSQASAKKQKTSPKKRKR